MDIPIKTLHLFPKLDEKLISLLNKLREEDWDKPTLAKKWTVKDIAAHLLDGNLRTLSMLRDGYFGEKPNAIQTHQDLVDFLNKLNSDWVTSFKRISPKILIELLKSSGEEYNSYLRSLDPFAKTTFSVSWAGETESFNWFHIARDYTEKWHHQKQIREAVGVGGLMEIEFTKPLFQTFMKALPHTYRNTKTEAGTQIHFVITQVGDWWLEFNGSHWDFIQSSIQPKTKIEISPDLAWKLLTKGMKGEEAFQNSIVEGDLKLSKPFFSMISIMG